ncbi:hypothetical protein PSECIP111951_02182 [Pseudoalteromonas holothuriae]|uniref:Uncharacterized protein n=1 Tax=Pseudoalteromonas holothuriae TaxID=2963714 RepID=A0A9W4QS78_9GAMM|nr:hypothetical protein PSECIP111854_00634 [Pseudoalteromonas sp. CIP111854]CAH9060001.1 hypothetical protein PSECIP111951_02182 [Pseudoalteromonas sp. CIP111951]
MCKHIVATALAALTHDYHKVTDIDPERQQIEQLLADKNQPELIALLLDCLAQSPEQWQSWLNRAKLSKAVSFRTLKSMITKAMSVKDIWYLRNLTGLNNKSKVVI